MHKTETSVHCKQLPTRFEEVQARQTAKNKRHVEIYPCCRPNLGRRYITKQTEHQADNSAIGKPSPDSDNEHPCDQWEDMYHAAHVWLSKKTKW